MYEYEINRPWLNGRVHINVYVSNNVSHCLVLASVAVDANGWNWFFSHCILFGGKKEKNKFNESPNTMYFENYV